MKTPSQRVVILANLDGFANSRKPLVIKKLLEARGHTVRIVDTPYISRASSEGMMRFLPSLSPTKFLLYLTEAARFMLERIPKTLAAPFNYYSYLFQMKLRGRLNVRQIQDFSVVICETQIDSAVMLENAVSSTKIYDCATPFADELYYGGTFTEEGYRKFKAFEMRVFASCDHLSFHWHSYANYVKKYYGDVPNLFTFDFMTEVNGSRAHFEPEPRIVYIGGLGGYWIDLQLLSELTKIYPKIDVYGLPKPPEKYNLNYKGYATPEVLQSYQFGLITSSMDRLRTEGFSAKHLDYLAAGLPVLVPKWRVSASDLNATIPYDVSNFVNQIRRYSAQDIWNETSAAAVEQARQYSPDNVMQQLIQILESRSQPGVGSAALSPYPRNSGTSGA